MLRVTGLRLSLDEDTEKLPFVLAKKLGIRRAEILSWYIFKESIDARRSTIHFVYTIDVAVKNEAYLISRLNDPTVTYVLPLGYRFDEVGTEKLKEPPVIIGTGPAGLFAGLLLAGKGYNPILLERGDDVDTRVGKINHFWQTGKLDEESNIQFGEGGAGTFSDGKLTTLIKDNRCRQVLEELVDAGARPEILYSYKPHIGTDVLRGVVKNIRRRINKLGGKLLFRSCVTDIIIDSNGVSAVKVNGTDTINTRVVILAIGHSARDTFGLLERKGVELTPKAFSIGVRVEHPQALINSAQYKEFAGHPRLGAAEYKLAYHSSAGRSAYTFCMCPGGMVVAAASEQGHLVTNGMSEYARAGDNANSALLVGVTPEDFYGDTPLAGIQFQKSWEQAAFAMGGKDYRAPVQLLGDFMADRISTRLGSVKSTYPRGVVLADLRECLPSYVCQTLCEAVASFDKKLRGFALEDVVLTGVETRSSSPVRIVRNEAMEGSIKGLYPAGEGAGYAGGIISAAVDGMKSAEAVARRYSPLDKKQTF